MITRESLVHSLEQYSSQYPEEMIFRKQFLDLLQHSRCFHRDFLPGHITGSAWIIDEENTKVLLTHHAKLNKWLQPGGHADGDENVLRVAIREAEEETGLKSFKSIQREAIFDIDIHIIPARKDFPEHFHYDVRFAFIADASLPLLITEESHDLKWFALDSLESLTDNTSLLRMRDKVKPI
jgi:8-oxo-dGTP pyrophosphatase MutT (NUDIX family)